MKKLEKVGEKLSEVVTTRLDDPRLAEVAYHFIDLCGGAKSFAQLLKQQFDQSPSGGVARQRYLDMIIRMLKVANDQDPRTGDLSLLSDEDLDREVKERVLKLNVEEEATIEDGARATGA